MSLDRRIRAGLDAEAHRVRPDVEAHLAATQQELRRSRLVRRSVLAAAVVAAVVVALPSWRALDGADDTVVVPADLTSAEARALLKGTWTTPRVTRDDVTDVLRTAGLAEHVDAVTLDLGHPTAWSLYLLRGRGYDVRSATDVQADTGSWDVRGSTLTLRPSPCQCLMVFRWRIEGDELHLRLLRDDSPDVDGIPDEAYARALYTAVPWVRSDAVDDRP